MNSLLKEIFSKECYMLDVESTGLDIYRNGITSFAFVKFDLRQPNFQDVITGLIHCKVGDIVNKELNTEYDNESWRFEHEVPKQEAEISRINTIKYSEDLKRILNANLLSYTRDNHLFALHPEFDVAFILKYFKHFNVDFPFYHRNVYDVASMCLGKGQSFQDTRDLLEYEGTMPRVPWIVADKHFRPHNAAYDCMIQIYTMWIIFNK